MHIYVNLYIFIYTCMVVFYLLGIYMCISVPFCEVNRSGSSSGKPTGLLAKHTDIYTYVYIYVYTHVLSNRVLCNFLELS